MERSTLLHRAKHLRNTGIKRKDRATTIYYTWIEDDGVNYQIWIATSNLDGTGFTATQQTTSAFDKDYFQLQVVGTTIYYIWYENDGVNDQIWTATSNLDGTGFTVTKQTVSALPKRFPELQVAGTTIYYIWDETDAAAAQIWTATSNLDGTGFTPTQQTTSAFDKYVSQLQVAGTTIYYAWTESDGANDQIWTAISSLVYVSSYFPRRQFDVTASRALNTTYTNSDSVRTLHVTATVRCAISVAAGQAFVQGKADTSTPPTTEASGIVGIQAGLLSEDNSHEVNFYVLPGNKYRIDSTAVTGTVTLGKWFEMLI